jgi:hypothetical protein
VLHVTGDLPVTITLNNIIRKAFPQQYTERATETAAAVAAAAAPGAGGGGCSRLPLFVMSAMVPGEKMALNIFEPR